MECALYVPHLAVTLAGAGVAVDPYVLVGNIDSNVNTTWTRWPYSQVAIIIPARTYRSW
ncbi:MAG: hypothetical protein WDO73_27355 [Ignavibacteriota bacterium]